MIGLIKKAFLPAALIFIGISFTGAYFSDSVSVSGNTFTTGTWESGTGRITISEFLYDPVDPDEGKEWIELKNNSASTLNMAGYVLRIEAGTGHDFVFPTFSLASGAFVVVHMDKLGTNTPTELFQTGIPPGNLKRLDDTQGGVALFSAYPIGASTIIDFVEYGNHQSTNEGYAVSASIWTRHSVVPVAPEGESIALINSSVDTNQITDWQAQTPTPGT